MYISEKYIGCGIDFWIKLYDIFNSQKDIFGIYVNVVQK